MGLNVFYGDTDSSIVPGQNIYHEKMGTISGGQVPGADTHEPNPLSLEHGLQSKESVCVHVTLSVQVGGLLAWEI